MKVKNIVFKTFILLLLCSFSSKSQDNDLPLSALEGFYQFPNKIAYIQFLQQDGQLVARQVWDGRVYHLTRLNELQFESKEEGYSIVFMKDSQGTITGSRVQGRVVLTKVGFNPQKTISLSKEELKKLEGTYQRKDMQIIITTKNNGLELKEEWDGKTYFFLPRTAEFFLDEDSSFPLTFLTDQAQVIAFTNDVWNKVK